MQLFGRFLRYFTETDGDAINAASVELRRQGASVNGIQSKTSGQTINVDEIGALRVDDTVEVWRAGTTQVSSSGGTNQFTVTALSYTNRTATLSNYSGTLSLSDEDRISVSSPAPTLYNDSAGNEALGSNVLTTSATGKAECWLPGGYYDFKISGSTAETTLYIDEYVHVAYTYNVRDARYGAKGDGTTDDTAAIQRALDEAYEDGAEGQGGIVEFPPGIYMVSSQLTVPGSRLILRGHDRRASILRATTGFSFNGTTDAVVRVGSGSTAAYSRLESLQIDGNNVANSICYYSEGIQENGGAWDCEFVRYRLKGVFIGGTFSAQNYSFRDCEFLPSASGTTSIGMDLNGAGRPAVRGITFNPYDGATVQDGPAIRIGNVGNGGLWSIQDINIEDHVSGIQAVGTSTSGFIMNVGTTAVTTVVTLAGPSWYLLNVAGQIADNSSGGNGTFTMNSGYYFLSNNGGAGTKSIFSDDSDTLSRMNSHFKFMQDVRFKDRTDVASATALVLGTGNYFNVTGTTQITSITTSSADNGRLIALRFATGAVNMMVDGSNLLLKGNFSPTVNDTITLWGDGTNWTELCRSTANVVRTTGPPVTGDFVFNSAVFTSATGSDTIGSVVFNPSTSSPDFTYTFKDGTYGTAPRAVVSVGPIDADGSLVIQANVVSVTVTATTLAVVFSNLNATYNYRASWVVM